MNQSCYSNHDSSIRSDVTGNSTINYSKKDELFVERARLIEVKFVSVYNANRNTILVEIFYADW